MLTPENTAVAVVDIQTRLLPSIRHSAALERKMAAFIAGCRLLELPVIVLQQYTKGLGETVPALQSALGDFSPIEKLTFSACRTEEFVEKVKFYGKPNIIVTGIEAHICVQMTVQDLLAAGHGVYVPADCIGSRKEADMNYAVERMRQMGAAVTTMEAVLFEMLARADHPMRKAITGLITQLD